MLRGAAQRANAATLAARLEREPPRRLLVVQTAFLGDTVFTSGLVSALRTRFPAAEIELCVAPRGRDVAEAIPGVARVHVFDKRCKDSGPLGLWRVARRILPLRFELAVLPHRSPRSALLALLAGIPHRLGFARAPGALFYTATAPDEGRTFLDREAQLARVLGAAPAPPRLVPREESLRAAQAALERAGCAGARLAVLCVGSEWETKIWPPERMGRLAALLHERGLVPLLLGGPREKSLAAEVARAARIPCVDTTGNPVSEALGLLARSQLCVGGDSGLVHAARALGVPTVALFGPTTPLVHLFGERERAVTLALSCSPCSKHGSRRCPLGHHDCLRKLEAERVALDCDAVLRGAA